MRNGWLIVFLVLMPVFLESTQVFGDDLASFRSGALIDAPEVLFASFDEADFEPAPPPISLTSYDLSRFSDAEYCLDGWELFPNGLLYTPYLAGEKEPRFAAQWLWERDRGLIWETSLGGRAGLFRYGTPGPNGEGFQLDLEGAGQARVDPEEESDLEAADFRAGIVGTIRNGAWRLKTGYYHISSHIGDEFLIKNPGWHRRNYVRDSALLGIMYDLRPDFQVYGEYAPAISSNGGAQIGEFQFGAQFNPVGGTGWRGAPFAAINGHLRQEFHYGGSVNMVAGWLWRGQRNSRTFRVGGMHYDGPSIQYSLFDRHESLTGVGMWLDY